MTAVSHESTVDAVALWGAGVNLQGQTKVTQHPVTSSKTFKKHTQLLPRFLLCYAEFCLLQLQICALLVKVDMIHEKLVNVL